MKEKLYFYKYLEYKEKYLKLKELLGGALCENIELDYIDIKKNGITGIAGVSRKYHPNLDQTDENYALQFTYSAIDPDSKKMNTYDGIFLMDGDIPNINIKEFEHDKIKYISITFTNNAEFQAHRKSNSFFRTNPITNNIPVDKTLMEKKFFFKKTDKSFEYNKCILLSSIQPKPEKPIEKTRKAYNERKRIAAYP
jgi:hypothetical protein